MAFDKPLCHGSCGSRRDCSGDMPTLGEELRRLREERGIALSDISEGTRIGTRFLKAIEENNFSVLPGGIFTRSFIRAYAKRVGMDEDEAIGRYQQQMAEESGELPPVREEKPPATVEPVDHSSNISITQ